MKPGFKQTELGVIPEDWDAKTIGSLADLYQPVTISAKQFTEAGFPVYGANGVVGFYGKTNHDTWQITVTCRGSTCGTVNRTVDHCWITGNAMVVNCDSSKSLDKEFFYHLLSSRNLSDCITGTGQPQIVRSPLAAYLVPIPPTTAEQIAIAGALGDADALIESLERLVAKKRDVKQGAMQELLTARRRLPRFTGKWELHQLGEIAAFFKGRGLSKSALDPFGETPCIHYGELFTQYPETIQRTISRTNSLEPSFRSMGYDVLMPTSDVTPRGLAKASCITIDGVILGGDILVIRPDSTQVFGPFLSYVIRREASQVLQLVTGTTVFHLYPSDMKKFAFLLPPLAEQKAIVATLSDLGAELEALEAKLSKAQAIKQGMMQELLTGRIRLK